MRIINRETSENVINNTKSKHNVEDICVHEQIHRGEGGKGNC